MISKEDFKALGWEVSNFTFEDSILFERGDYKLWPCPDGRIFISLKDLSSDPTVGLISNGSLFLGPCRDLEDLVRVMELTGIINFGQ